jgi:hypothetical protein
MLITRICFSLIKITKFNVFPFKKHFYKAEKFPHEMILLPTIIPTGDNSQKGVKTVQTMLAAKKTGNTSKQNPPKRDKRTHSDVAEDSVEGIDLIFSIQKAFL